MSTGTALARIEEVQRASHPAKKTIIVRLPERVSITLRKRMLAHGDMANMIEASLRRVDLDCVKLLDLKAERQFGKPKSTTINIDHSLHEEIKQAASRRSCSMNLFISSVLAEHLHPLVTSGLASRARLQRARALVLGRSSDTQIIHR